MYVRSFNKNFFHLPKLIISDCLVVPLQSIVVAYAWLTGESMVKPFIQSYSQYCWNSAIKLTPNGHRDKHNAPTE
jgi:hypothetical protein